MGNWPREAGGGLLPVSWLKVKGCCSGICRYQMPKYSTESRYAIITDHLFGLKNGFVDRF